MIPAEWLQQWNAALPWHRAELLLLSGWCGVLLIMSFPRLRSGPFVPIIAGLVALSYSALLLVTSSPAAEQLYSLSSDGIATGAKVTASALAVLWFGWQALNPERRSGEYAFLTLCILAGTAIAAEADHWITAVLGLEIVSLSTYVLVAWRRQESKAAEAALRYMLFGAFSSAVLIYGISWWYGHFGTLSFYITESEASAPVLWMLILTGLMFKLGAVPMHFYLPEVYEGMSWPTVGFLGILPRIGALALLYRLNICISDPAWAYLIAGGAGISMLWGSLSALRQDRLKRMVAFSGIAQGGYVLASAVSVSASLMAAGFLYQMWYGLATILFALTMDRLDPQDKRPAFESWTGTGAKLGSGGFILVAALASLIGLPPFTGFVAKLVLGFSIIGNGSPVAWIMLITLLASTVISAYYYLRLGLEIYFKKKEEPGTWVMESRYTMLFILVVLSLVIPTAWGFYQAHAWLGELISVASTRLNP